MTVQGIDVSRFQAHIDWQRVKQAGYSFAFIKATEGAGYKDANYNDNLARALDAGLLAGPYHYYRLHTDPLSQAKWFCDSIEPLRPGMLQPVLDMEEPGTLDVFRPGEGPKTVLNALDIMNNYITKRLGVNLTLYTYPYYWLTRLGNPKGYNTKFALWLANYTKKPLMIGDWEFASFLQYTATGVVPGIASHTDLNKFNGTIEQLRRFAHN